jgi:hypothetical protein
VFYGIQHFQRERRAAHAFRKVAEGIKRSRFATAKEADDALEKIPMPGAWLLVRGAGSLANEYLWGTVPRRGCALAVSDASVCVRECDSGNFWSCKQAGLAYLNGYGGATRSGPRMLEYSQKACDHGIAKACSNMAIVYADRDYAVLGDQTPAGRDNQAFMLFKQACSLGFLAACTNVAKWRLEGRAVEKSPAAGMAILRSGCELGDNESCKVYSQYDGGAAQSQIQ